MLKRSIGVIILLAAFPLLASALTLDEIKAQLLEILDRVTALQATIETAAPVTSDNRPFLPCLSLGRTLRAGMGGEDVQKLQELLIRVGMLSKGKATGYFGPLTETAVKKWQAAHGVVSSGDADTTGYGIVGPKTRAAILSSCKGQIAKSQDSQTNKCPREPSLPIQSECAAAWQKGFDSAGCLTGYQCAATTNIEVVSTSYTATSSLAILSPTSHTLATGGNTLLISWRSVNPSRGFGVNLFVDDASGVVGEIARGLAPSGTYLWRVPQGSTDCAAGENAFDCIEKFARCDSGANICTLTPGTYMIRAEIAQLEAVSEQFQIAGTAITDTLRNLLGAPAPEQPYLALDAAPSGTSSDSGTASSSIIQDGYPATTTVSSGYSVGCPQEGWRAYLSCPYGGCVTGWNVCRGGVWVLDTVQTTAVVGMQGPCDSAQVWCGIGFGFGCVAKNLCVNGNAI